MSERLVLTETSASRARGRLESHFLRGSERRVDAEALIGKRSSRLSVWQASAYLPRFP